MADPVLQIRGNGGEGGDPPVCPKISGGGGVGLPWIRH